MRYRFDNDLPIPIVIHKSFIGDRGKNDFIKRYISYKYVERIDDYKNVKFFFLVNGRFMEKRFFINRRFLYRHKFIVYYIRHRGNTTVEFRITKINTGKYRKRRNSLKNTKNVQYFYSR